MLFGTQTLVAALAVSFCLAAGTTTPSVTPPDTPLATPPTTAPATAPGTAPVEPVEEQWTPSRFTKALQNEDEPLDVSKLRYFGDGHHKSPLPVRS